MNTLVYTYKNLNYNVYIKDSKQKEWIIRSIESARKVGYTNIELYTNDIEFSKDLDLNKVHIVEDYNHLWDSLKIWVLSNRNDDYFLCDNDVIFNNQIPLDSSTDIYFDGIEIHNWNWAYKSTMDYLKRKKIFNDIDFWKYDRMGVYNVGILKINNTKLKKNYIKYWNQLYKEIQPHLDLIDTTFITPIITQYLLTLLVNKDNFTYKFFTKDSGWPYNNEYYNHYCGILKFEDKTPI